SLGADLLQSLELLHAGNAREHQRVAQKGGLRIGARRVLERKDDSVPDHHSAPTASLAAMAAMLTMPRLVTDGARMWAGARVPIRIGPTASALFISLSSVIERFAASRSGKIKRLASPFSTVSGT